MFFAQFYMIFAIFTRFFYRHKYSAARHLKLFCTPALSSKGLLYAACPLCVSLQSFKMLPSISDVDHDGLARDLAVRDNHHDIGVGSEHVNKCREVGVPDLQIEKTKMQNNQLGLIIQKTSMD